MSFDLGLSFDDVLIKPTFSNVRSRNDVSTSVMVAGIKLEVPLISSPMDTVTEVEMAYNMSKLGGLGILHRFAELEERISMVAELTAMKSKGDNIIIVPSFGVSDFEKDAFQQIYNQYGGQIDAICIDVANGYCTMMQEMVEYIRSIDQALPIIAGNIADGEGYKFLAELGVNAVRVGIGGGSICKTRIQTGIGIPTLQTVLDCNEARKTMPFDMSPSILADGGIKYPADLCKAMIAGADAVICGGIFAGTKEAPGEVIYDNENIAWKKYRGMASSAVQEEKKGGLKPGTVAEGVSTLIRYKGSLERVVNEFKGGLKSSMTYVNARKTEDYIGRDSLLLRVTENGVKESHAYGTRKR